MLMGSKLPPSSMVDSEKAIEANRYVNMETFVQQTSENNVHRRNALESLLLNALRRTSHR
jgi:hypothetical protein